MKGSKASEKPIDSTALIHRQFEFSVGWVHGSQEYTTQPTGAVLQAAQDVISKYAPTAPTIAKRYTAYPNATIGGFSIPLARSLGNLDIGVLAALCTAHGDCVGFTSNGELKTNAAVAARVAHEGVTLYVSSSQD